MENVPLPLSVPAICLHGRSILGQLGLSNVFITDANRVERFYFDCQALRPEVMRRELLIGLEQVWEAACAQLNSLVQRVQSVALMLLLKLPKEKKMRRGGMQHTEEGFSNSTRWGKCVQIRSTWHSPLSHPCQHPWMLSFVITVVST